MQFDPAVRATVAPEAAHSFPGPRFKSTAPPEGMEFMFHAARAPMKLGYTRLAYQGRDLALAGFPLSQRVVA